MSNTRKALASGATTDDVQHAVLLSLTTVGFPAMIAAMGWVSEVMKKQGQQALITCYNTIPKINIKRC